MRKHYIRFLRLISFVLLLSLLVSFSYALENQGGAVISVSTFFYEDGSRDVIMIIRSDPGRTVHTLTGYVIQNHYSSENELVWRVKLTGTFTYDGTTSSCTDAYTTITFYKSGWSVLAENTGHTGCTASTCVMLGKNVLGVVLHAATVNLTLTCDKDGNLS